MAALLLSMGCCARTSTTIDDIDLRGDRGLAGSQDHLARAIATLERSDQFDPNEAHAKVISQLSQWIESQESVDDWLVDPLERTIPAEYRWVFRYAPLNRMQFVATDVSALRQAIWLRQIANYQLEMMREQEPQPFYRVDELTTALRKLQRESEALDVQLDDPKLQSADEKAELEAQKRTNQQRQTEITSKLAAAANDLELQKAAWLFDWTTRNIRLKETHWDAKFPAGDEASAEELVPPPGAE